MMPKKMTLVFLALFTLQSVAAIAEEPKKGAKQAKPEVVSASTPGEKNKASNAGKGSKQEVAAPSLSEKDKVPKVAGVRRALPPHKVGMQDEAGLGHAIRVKVENLDQFLAGLQGDGKEKEIHLFLDGMEIKGIQPEFIDKKSSEIQFRLLRREALPSYLNDSQQKSVWAALFGFRDHLARTRQVRVSVGPEGGKPLDSNPDVKLKLIRIRTGWALLYLLVLILMVIVYWVAARKGMFRDRGKVEGGEAKTALSLARSQMGFWFFLVVAAFFFIWVVIGELPTIPSSVLALIGIASGTALGAAAIDANKRASASALVDEQSKKQAVIDELEKRNVSNSQELEALKKEIEGLTAKLSSEPALKSQIELKTQALEKLKKEIDDISAKKLEADSEMRALKGKSDAARSNMLAVKSTGHWLDDLLNDADGPSFHRMQMAIWTIVLAIVFIVEVGINLALPDFDSTLLALMGISSGTYLGFKFPEQQPQK